MDYKEVLIDSQKSGIVAYHKFMLQYHNFENVIANFVEGKDQAYYESRVSNYKKSNSDILFYPCNGRHEVELVKKLIDNNLHLDKKVKTLYFCDNDYGIKNQIQNIFYTDYYSVENYYTSKKFIINVITKIFNISKYDLDYNRCLALYDEKYKLYNEQMIKVNAYCYSIREKEKEKAVRERIDIRKLNFSNFVECKSNIDNFKMKNLNFNELKELFPNDLEIKEEEYNNNINKIDNTKLRGKWELEFVVWFLESLRIAIKNGDNGLQKNDSIKFSFQNEIMISMERFADTTDKLIDYIAKNS